MRCWPLLALAASWAASSVRADSSPTYFHDIKPILQSRCVVCHSEQTVRDGATSGGLALDTLAAIRRGARTTAGYRALFTAGHANGSNLMARLTATSPTRLMPRGGPPLPADQIALVRRWIDAGAPTGTAPASADSPAVRADAAARAMPAPAARLDVPVDTDLTLPAPKPAKPGASARISLDLKIGPLAPVTSLAYSPDGSRLLVGTYRGVVAWDTRIGRPAGAVAHLSGPVEAISFRPGGKQFAIGSGAPAVSGEVRVYDSATLQPVGELHGAADLVYAVAWSQDGNHLAAASQDKTARIWEWPSGKPGPVLKDHSDAVTAVCFSPDGKVIYTASLDHNVRRFDAATGALQQTFTGHNDAVLALAVTADGKRLVSSGQEPGLRWWNAASGDTVTVQGGHGAAVTMLARSSDGKAMLSASADGTVRRWDAGSTGQLADYSAAGVWQYGAAIAPDGKLVAGAGADGIVRLWDAASRKLRLSLIAWPPRELNSPIEWAALTPEGCYDASAGWAPRISLTSAGQAVRRSIEVRSLQQPAQLQKAWRDEKVEAATSASKTGK